jgi:hypothetical protein
LKRVHFAAAMAALLWLEIAPAHSTTIRHLDIRELTEQSSDIVIGQVRSVRRRWNETHTRVVTDVEFRVARRLKGARAGRLLLMQPGGTIGDRRDTVPGGPVFRPGEEALLFLWRDARGRAQVNALAQGKFDIRRDPRTGTRLVQRQAPGSGVRDLRWLAPLEPGERAPELRLADLMREIQRVLEEEGR